MKSKVISAAVLAVAAFSSMGASAELYNSWLFDQMATPSTRTRAEVKAEVLQAQQARPVMVGGTAAPASSSYDGALAQQNLATPQPAKASAVPQAGAGFVKTSE